MSYIWVPLMEAVQLGYDTTKIQYRIKDQKVQTFIGDEIIQYNVGLHSMSPWIEHMPHVLYDPNKTVKIEDKLSHVDINPYHRFGFIFDTILRPERNDPNDLILCDVIIHMLAHIDRICGMSKRDFQILLIMDEIDAGCFGGADDAVRLFNMTEKRALAEAIIMLYETANGVRCLESLFAVIMTDFAILCRDNEEVVFWNSCGFDECADKKLKFIIKLFLPIDFPHVVHWRYTYGVIEHDESIMLEKFVL